jgi:predicted TIM-barrel fold metal-dependent hydrolase
MDEPLIVVSSDAHVGPRLREDLRPYCPARLLEVFDRYTDANVDPVGAFGRAPGTGFAIKGAAIKAAPASRLRNFATGGHFDVHARLRDMDHDGIAAEVIFHGSQNGQPFPLRANLLAAAGKGSLPKEDADVAATGNDIYNRWLADFVSVEPHRHVGLAQLSMWDVERATDEVAHVAALGLTGINLPAPRDDIEPYNDAVWDPFWAACQEHGMVLANHGGNVTPEVSAPGAYQITSMELMALSRISLVARLVFGGVFERFPGLHLVITERPGAWLRAAMDEMDSLARGGSISSPLDHLTRLPSDYVHTNVFVGASFHARFEAEAAVRDGYAENVCWGSDYPHTEGSFQYPHDWNDEPTTRLSWRATYAGLPHDAVAACSVRTRCAATASTATRSRPRPPASGRRRSPRSIAHSPRCRCAAVMSSAAAWRSASAACGTEVIARPESSRRAARPVGFVGWVVVVGELVAFGLVAGGAADLAVARCGWSASAPGDDVVGLEPCGWCVAAGGAASSEPCDQ